MEHDLGAVGREGPEHEEQVRVSRGGLDVQLRRHRTGDLDVPRADVAEAEHAGGAFVTLRRFDAAVAALTRVGADLAQFGEFALARRDLIASSLDLQERDLMKMTSLTAAIAEGLRGRAAPRSIAMFAAKAAVAVFTAAYDDWADDATADFSALMQRALGDLRHAIGCTQADGD